MPDKKPKGVGRPRKHTNAFSRWLDSKGWTRENAAERLGVSRVYVDKLCRSERRPNLELAIRIEDLSKGKVSCRSWLKVPKHSND